MKKVLAFLLAVSASLSVGVTALADDIIDNNENSSIVAQEDSSSEDSSSEDSSSEDSSSEDSSSEGS